MDGATGRDFHAGGELQILLAPRPAGLYGVSKPAEGSLRRNTNPDRLNLGFSFIWNRFARFSQPFQVNLNRILSHLPRFFRGPAESDQTRQHRHRRLVTDRPSDGIAPAKRLARLAGAPSGRSILNFINGKHNDGKLVIAGARPFAIPA